MFLCEFIFRCAVGSVSTLKVIPVHKHLTLVHRRIRWTGVLAFFCFGSIPNLESAETLATFNL